ncbi:response regulator [Parapedomonas caeni]
MTVASSDTPLSLHVLIVDDDDLVLDSISAEVESLGCTVITAESGDAACAILATGSPVDTVLTDLNLHGGMDGRGLLTHVRARHPTIRVVLMSGSLTDADQLSEPNCAALPKPFTRAQLRAALHGGN